MGGYCRIVTDPTSAPPPSRPAPLISAGELLETYADHVVLDVQYTLGGPPSEQEYAVAHLPGAAHLSMDRDLAGQPGPLGRHPLPSRAQFETALQRCGVNDGDSIVVYDGRTSLSAGRAWWLLRHFGVDTVRVLDGGLAAWLEAGGPVATAATDEPKRPLGSIRLTADRDDVVSIAEAAELARDGRLWDVRAAERFRGEVEPIDPVAGHIPGARNAPATDLLRPDGTFKSASALGEHARALGIEPGDATSCGSGVTAAQAALAWAIAGIPVKVFVGSWSQWCAEGREVARGD